MSANAYIVEYGGMPVEFLRAGYAWTGFALVHEDYATRFNSVEEAALAFVDLGPSPRMFRVRSLAAETQPQH